MTSKSKTDQKIIDVISNSRFTLSAEVIPRRNGSEQAQVLEQIDLLIKSGYEFLSVTKGAGGSLRGGSLPIAHSIKEQFDTSCIAHFTCRDLSPQDIENQLIDHHYFGIRNILALRGDPPMGQPDWKPKSDSYPYAYQLIEQIKKLNAGVYLKREDSSSQQQNSDGVKTDFCIGSAVYPEHPNEKERIDFFKMKVEAGAEYGISQMLFDTEAYASFLDRCEKNNINVPILPGTRVLKSQKQALNMAKRFEVNVPKSLLQQLPEEASPDSTNQILDVFSQYIEDLKKLGAPGIHVFVLFDTEISCGLINKIKD